MDIKICTMCENNKTCNKMRCNDWKPNKNLRSYAVDELEKVREKIQSLIDFEEGCSGNTTLGYECLGIINDTLSDLKGENK